MQLNHTEIFTEGIVNMLFTGRIKFYFDFFLIELFLLRQKRKFIFNQKYVLITFSNIFKNLL